MIDITRLPLDRLTEALWNSNFMAPSLLAKLKASIRRYGMVGVLVVRLLSNGKYEVLSGNQRLQVLRELGYTEVDCIIVDLDEPHAKLLADSINHLHGQADLGLRAELLKGVLAAIPAEEVLAVLPESGESLQTLVSMGRETMAEYLSAWQDAQSARLKHLQFQLSGAQLEVVEEALALVLPKAKGERGENPNLRGTALFLLCQAYLDQRGV